MARIKKPGLNYFPLDVDFMNDRKIRKIMREHGAITASAIIAIYSSIYKDKGYYLQWDDDICFDISEVVMVKTDVLKGIVTACVDLEIFNKSLFDEYRILTSEAIQSQYRLCTQRRKINEMDERFILIPIEAAVEDGTHERGSGVQESGSAGDGVGNLPLNANQSTQRKGKEKKEKKTLFPTLLRKRRRE